MRTQGWRRYNVAELAHGRFSRPTSPLEIGAEISGIVKSVLLAKPVENMEVTVMSLKGNYFDNTQTDKDGRFYLRGGELPDSTRFIVSAIPKRGMTRMELLIDGETFPERTLPAVPSAGVDRNLFAKYADKAEQKYIYEGGIRVLQLSEVTISAERKPPRKSSYYSSPSNSITEEDMEKFPVTDLRQLLMRIPGVMVSGNNISIRGGGPPLLVIDDVPMDIEDIDMMNVFDVAQIDVLKDAGNTAVFGSRGGNGVIVIFTKDGTINRVAPKPFHIKTILPLGYQTPVEFYAPKYDTPAKQRAQTPDLRTTIHWQPVVRTDSVGVASFEFYTADEPTPYTVVIEGMANDGRIIRQEGKLWRKNE
jgi:TonB-dependent SusC/RagA subfamily outer membrane receptor